MIDREAIANHLYRRGAWTLDVCRKVAEEIVSLTREGEGAVPVGYMRPEDVGKRSFWVADQSNTYYRVPVYPAPHPPRQDELCSDCPPVGYPTDKTRCLPCPRRQDGARKVPVTPAAIADALEQCRWDDTPIGNKAIIQSAITALRTAPPAPDEAAERLSETAQRNVIYRHVSSLPGVAKTMVNDLRMAGYEIARSRRDGGGGV